MNNYEPINLTYYNPCNSFFKAGKSDRERVTLYTCCNKDNCDAYKRNKCVMLNGLWGHNCPYGNERTETGFTKAARNCGKLIREYKEKYGSVEYSKKDLGFICYIGDYVFLNLPHLINYVNSIRDRSFFIDEDMIKKEDFTPEFVVELIKFRPYAMFGGEIKSYQEEEVPKFCMQLKRYMPDMYEQVKAIYPEIDNYIEDVNYIGKYAKVKTLLPGDIKVSIYNCKWDGKVIYSKAKGIGIHELGDAEVTITPNDNTYVKIVDNATVTEETEFRDE